jgi:2',3'-cyclic-nucleotide 2'-phosphodiesterase (5'-nucleotidase family)
MTRFGFADPQSRDLQTSTGGARPRFRLGALIVLAVGCLLGGVAHGEEHASLTVLFTSDIHAHVLPFDDIREQPADGSLAQVATLVSRVRAASPRTIVLDGGDAIQGTPLGYYAIVAAGASGEDPTIAAMNLVGYDAAVVGNHEFNFGLAVLRRSLSQSKFPWLAANLSGAGPAGLPVRDELVIERGGVRVGILGLTNPNVPHWEEAAHWTGLSFRDPVTVASERLARLRARADVVIVVVHAGFERDLGNGEANDTDSENFAWRLAQLPGIDLLLTGHTHRNIPPRALGKTVVAQPGKWATLVTRVDLDLERTPAGWRVGGWQGTNLSTAGESPDPRVVAAVAAAEQRTSAELSRPIGTLTAPLVVHPLPLQDDPGVDLIHAVQLEASGAQLSLAAPLGMNTVEFPAGRVTPRLVHALYPYENTLVEVRLSGSEVKDVLEHAVRGWTGLDCTAPPGCALRRDPRVPSYNFDTLEGATYLVDPAAPIGQRVRGLRFAGAPIQPADVFTVAVNSYRAAGGGGFPHLAAAPRVKEIDRPMVDLIVEYLARHATITPTSDDNWAFMMRVHEPLDAAPK